MVREEKLFVITKADRLKGKIAREQTEVIDGGEEYTNLELVEVCLVLGGVGSCFVLGQEMPCKSGDVFIIPPGVRHRYSTNGLNGLTVRKLWFCVDDWFDGEVASYGDNRYCYGVFLDSPIVAYAMLTARAQNEINAILNVIRKETSEEKAEWRDIVKSQLAMLLITVARYVGGAIKTAPRIASREWGIVYALMREVEERYSDCELTLESLAESLYVSTSHLSKQFKKFTGQNFSDYLKSLRFDCAKTLFEQTNLTAQEIMQKCGMRDLASFYHGFAQRFGSTPTKYRQETKKNKNNEEEKLMNIINEISENLQKGKSKIVKELVQQAIDEGASVERILNEGLLLGMSVIGEKFKNNEVYVPEVLVSARAMNAGIQILKPYMSESGIEATGKVCIGTVQGDLHDIGKNLVKLMMESKGLEVIDLGTDVAPETFVQTAIDENCQVICCSALLTTTMGVMEEVVKTAERMNVRDKVKIMVGGAPVNEEFAKRIGADVYTVDAASASEVAVQLCKN